jgi:hypothetical protein
MNGKENTEFTKLAKAILNEPAVVERLEKIDRDHAEIIKLLSRRRGRPKGSINQTKASQGSESGGRSTATITSTPPNAPEG